MNQPEISSKNSKLPFKIDIQSYTLIIALVGIAVIFTVLTGGEFLSSRNISNLFTQMSVIAILAIGMTLVIVAGHIDLSVGSIVGLTGGIAAMLQVWQGWSTPLVVLTAVVVGAVLGLWQGWWVAYRAVPAFIATLGGMLIFRGILIGLSDGQTVAGLNQGFKQIGNSYLPYMIAYIIVAITVIVLIVTTVRNRQKRNEMGLLLVPASLDYGKVVLYSVFIVVITYMLNRYLGVPTPFLIVVATALLFVFVTNKTAFGRRVYAMGGNPEAAALSGINIKRNTLSVFVIMGALAGLAGVLLTARLNAATVSAGNSYELDAIAACVIGGTSLMGGKGRIFGALIGALIMASIDNGMSMMNIGAYWQYIVKGLILILAVWIDMVSKNK
ncbi:sugar ABC transporter permease [Lysinibacillus sp. 3P01SB]|uniref:sugar ABC transporter permease n=1 Tax=Lysinibacillus sp. 3P01SB TaxID=3132284 RepID=UPI0039A4A726